MVGIARYALKGPFHAFTIVGLLAVLSLIFPFVSLLSGAIVSLIILTQGLSSGLKIIALSVVATSLMTWITSGSPLIGVMIGLVQWLPMVILSEALRRTQSLNIVIVMTMVLGVIAAALQFWLWPDLASFWRDMVEQMFSQSQQGMDYNEIKPRFDQIVDLMVLFFVAAMVMTFLSTLILGRWMQAKLLESDGFTHEFYSISLGKQSAIAAVLIIGLSLYLGFEWLVAVALVVATCFLFQGLSVVHKRVSQKKKKKLLLFIFYFLLFVLPQILALTALLGIIDNWFQFRQGVKTPTNID